MRGLFGRKAQAKQTVVEDGEAKVSDARASIMEALNTLIDINVCETEAQSRTILQERIDRISTASATFPELVAPVYREFVQIALAMTVIKSQFLKAHQMKADQDVVKAAVDDMKKQALLAVEKLS